MSRKEVRCRALDACRPWPRSERPRPGGGPSAPRGVRLAAPASTRSVESATLRGGLRRRRILGGHPPRRPGGRDQGSRMVGRGQLGFRPPLGRIGSHRRIHQEPPPLHGPAPAHARAPGGQPVLHPARPGRARGRAARTGAPDRVGCQAGRHGRLRDGRRPPSALAGHRGPHGHPRPAIASNSSTGAIRWRAARTRSTPTPTCRVWWRCSPTPTRQPRHVSPTTSGTSPAGSCNLVPTANA